MMKLLPNQEVNMVVPLGIIHLLNKENNIPILENHLLQLQGVILLIVVMAVEELN